MISETKIFKREKYFSLKIILLVIIFLIGIILSLFFGGTEKINFSSFGTDNFIFTHIRIPKTITAILAGFTLSVSGLILQIIFRNPLAGPYVLGISSGASLFVAFGIMAGKYFSGIENYFFWKSTILLFAVAGSTLSTVLILSVSTKIKSNVILLLVGLMLSQIFGAAESCLEYFSDPGNLKSFVLWGMGSLSSTTLQDCGLYLIISLLTLSCLVFFIKPLNAFLLGEFYTQNLGINFYRSRFFLILISSTLTGITTAYCGPLAFIGMSVPVLMRNVFSTSSQGIQILTGMFGGAILLLFSDVICNQLLNNAVLPINMITTLIGAPLIIYLMYKNKTW